MTVGSVYTVDFYTKPQTKDGKADNISSLLFDTKLIAISDYDHQTTGHVRVSPSPSETTVFQVRLETEAYQCNTKLAALKKEYITLKQTRQDLVNR